MGTGAQPTAPQPRLGTRMIRAGSDNGATNPTLSGLNLIARPTNPNPLDPNGVDVYGELPYMRSAYALTANGQAQNGKQEAMYAIIRNQDGPSRTKPVLSGNRHDSLTVPTRTMAIVHTHPLSGNPMPSDGDMVTAKSSRIPDYVYSARNGGQTLQSANPNGSSFKYDVNSWNAQPIQKK